MGRGIKKGTELPKIPLIKRFNEKYKIMPNNCWHWTAHLGHFGYGKIYNDKKASYAHRVSWELHNGEIPEGMSVLHKCDNPQCVNPDHLFLGKQGDNVSDMLNKGRGIANRQRNYTHCKNGHPLFGYNLRPSLKEGRVCRICANERNRLYRIKKGN